MKADIRGNLMDADKKDCDALYKPLVQQYCNVHNPCPGEGTWGYFDTSFHVWGEERGSERTCK